MDRYPEMLTGLRSGLITSVHSSIHSFIHSLTENRDKFAAYLLSFHIYFSLSSLTILFTSSTTVHLAQILCSSKYPPFPRLLSTSSFLSSHSPSFLFPPPLFLLPFSPPPLSSSPFPFPEQSSRFSLPQVYIPYHTTPYRSPTNKLAPFKNFTLLQYKQLIIRSQSTNQPIHHSPKDSTTNPHILPRLQD